MGCRRHDHLRLHRQVLNLKTSSLERITSSGVFATAVAADKQRASLFARSAVAHADDVDHTDDVIRLKSLRLLRSQCHRQLSTRAGGLHSTCASSSSRRHDRVLAIFQLRAVSRESAAQRPSAAAAAAAATLRSPYVQRRATTTAAVIVRPKSRRRQIFVSPLALEPPRV